MTPKLHVCYSFGSSYWHFPSKTNTNISYPNITYKKIFFATFQVIFIYFLRQKSFKIMWWVELHQKIDYDVEGDVWNFTLEMLD